ncbi:hypothetical protein MAMC_00953 [Methylacidimicrobium cyclopophantes]|uniref:Uncharacterized protein n=1 Tax=Methylacidimicrobium cyclopophantes TaxID=1041766 RepID=A0A5E6M993_9BACT|nr:hypothetical protein MAMC_00953 [Methylacidimicrobium cyclopophantes]
MIYSSDGRDRDRMRFRQRRDFLARQVAIFRSGKRGNLDPPTLPLRKVVIGPCADPDVSKASVEMLLLANGYGAVDVVGSQIPFRPV